MQVFWVYVYFFIRIIITSFYRISVFSFNIRLIFFVCYQLLFACSVPQSSSSWSSSPPPEDELGGNESDKSFAGIEREGNSGDTGRNHYSNRVVRHSLLACSSFLGSLCSN